MNFCSCAFFLLKGCLRIDNSDEGFTLISIFYSHFPEGLGGKSQGSRWERRERGKGLERIAHEATLSSNTTRSLTLSHSCSQIQPDACVIQEDKRAQTAAQVDLNENVSAEEDSKEFQDT